jgi:cyanophycin synthetase
MTNQVRVEDKWRVFQGYAFGFHQPVIISGFQFSEKLKNSQTKLQGVFERLLGSLPDLHPASPNDKQVCEFLLAWMRHLERSCRISVIERGKVLSLTKASDDCLFCQVALPYIHPLATHSALKWVIETSEAVFKATTIEERQAASAAAANSLQVLRGNLIKLGNRGINTDRILHVAVDKGIPFQHFEGETYIFGYGRKSRWLRSTFTDETGLLSTEFSRRKALTARLLDLHGLPVAAHHFAKSADEAVQHAEKLGYPVVVKPADQDGGRGVHAGLHSAVLVRTCFEDALRYSKAILVEKHFEGRDYRLTVLHGRMIKAIERVPGGVIGDSKQNIRELLDEACRDPNAQRRMRERGKALLTLDEEAMELLAEEQMNPDSVPQAGCFIKLRRRANVSTGGKTRYVMDEVHPDNQHLAERAALVMRLDVAGIDLLIPDIAVSWKRTAAIICEVNAQPQFSENNAPGLYGAFLKALLKGDGRIPVALILRAISVNHGKRLGQLALSFSGGESGTMMAAADVLQLDDECWNPAHLGFMKSARAALNSSEADRVLLAATASEILTQGVPVSRLDLLIIEPSAIDGSATNRLGPLLLPHLKGPMVFSAQDPDSVALAQRLPMKWRCMISLDKDTDILKRHLSDGGLAFWTDGLDQDGCFRVFTGAGHKTQLLPHTLGGAMDGPESSSLIIIAVGYLKEHGGISQYDNCMSRREELLNER